MGRGRKAEYKKDEIIKIYRKKSLERNKPYTLPEIEKDSDFPSLSVIYRLFSNGIKEIRKMAGIKPVITIYDTKKEVFIEKRGKKPDLKDYSLSDESEGVNLEQFCEDCIESFKECGKNPKECFDKWGDDNW